MSNVQITNGTVKHGRTVKTGDFENKRADVELSFNIPEGEDADAAIAHVHQKAKAHLTQILCEEAPQAPAKAAAPRKAAAPKVPVPATVAQPSAPKVDASVIEDAPVEEQEKVPGFLTGGKSAAVQDRDEIDNFIYQDEGAETAREITDKDLNDATQKCQAANKNSPAIRKLLNELGIKVPPGRIIDLPQEKRQVYLNKLLEIKPLA